MPAARRILVAWLSTTAYSRQPRKKSRCERLALRAVYEVERRTGCKFVYVAISYVYYLLSSFPFSISSSFSGPLHRYSNQRYRHLTVRFMECRYWNIYTAHIYVNYRYEVSLTTYFLPSVLSETQRCGLTVRWSIFNRFTEQQLEDIFWNCDWDVRIL